MTASAAARRISSGPGSSGKPWPRLMALLSRASCDIASKIVTGRLAKTLFMECMGGSTASLGGQTRGEMPVVGEPVGLRGQRRRHRALSRTAGKNHLLGPGIRNVLGIEAGKRHHDGVRIRLDRHFVRLADVDQKVAPFGDPLR